MQPKNNFDEHFSDAEKAQFQAFADNPYMLQAVKKALLLGLYEQGTIKAGADPNPTANFALALAFNMESRSNEEIGADLRACAEAIRMLETAFNKMLAHKTPETKADKNNPAR